MPTFADQWNAHVPADIVLSRHAKIITISGATDEVREVDDDGHKFDWSGDCEMEDAEALNVVDDVRNVREEWEQYRSNDPDYWEDAMDIDYESTGGHDAIRMVIDTNILLSYLDRLKEVHDILRDAGMLNMIELVIPGIVLEELDAQHKRPHPSKPELRESAGAATRWLLGEIKRRKSGEPSMIRVQKDGETHIDNISWKISTANNDDIILDCCQYFAKSANKIYLMTDDVNLSTKAEANDIRTLNRYDLRSAHSFVEHFVPNALTINPNGHHSPNRQKQNGVKGKQEHDHASHHHSRATAKASTKQHAGPKDNVSKTSSLPGGKLDRPAPTFPIHSGTKNPMEDVDLGVQPDPPCSPGDLHKLFLEYLTEYLPAETVSTLRKLESEPSNWQSWSSKACIEELKQARPSRPPPAPIEWTCLLAFCARPGESGYRANGGGRGDWEKAIRMLRLVGETYGLSVCLGDASLQNLEKMMLSSMGLVVSR
ncbi:hypothetical protein DACRYDRAFT_112999 [Dacryopinax primogenitus]|uniref:PIN domain-containing protein n=1 Tax=Dacryopinax primogenitus (strain DJM 731) TaxID=1858805 RepID=M5GCK4_DACPD|nr:uncharacterized protein DACRYDRAFT_112999 [Dacryopinax primogenitus]EJU06265.1 hypothetical protein DACRYDRAFT_112999 [Dacryopinax primogenitus]